MFCKPFIPSLYGVWWVRFSKKIFQHFHLSIVYIFVVHPGGGERLNNAILSLYYPGVTTTPSHPKYQNNNINNTQMSDNYHKIWTEFIYKLTNLLGRKSLFTKWNHNKQIYYIAH